MKKLLGIVVLGLLLSGKAYAEIIYINCENTIKNTKFLFKINTSKKAMTLIPGIKGEQVTTKFNDEIIIMKIKDVESFDKDPLDKNKLILSNKGDYIFHLNRVTGIMSYLHDNPSKKKELQSYTNAKCIKVKKQI